MMDPSASFASATGYDHHPSLKMLSTGYQVASNRWSPYAAPTGDNVNSAPYSVNPRAYQYSYDVGGDLSAYGHCNGSSAVVADEGDQLAKAYGRWPSTGDGSFTLDEIRSDRGCFGNSPSPGSTDDHPGDRRFHPPSQLELRRRRLAANERERKRMNSLNCAFDRLRNVLPSIESGKNLSKIETLLMAQEYIRVLEELISGNGNKQ
uniref:BHLH domain-containing protein n=1 Tax=Trichuris muris TaxID=70415 RepID=A0A5S6R2S0_TRIMR